jgi:hypothetical protein
MTADIIARAIDILRTAREQATPGEWSLQGLSDDPYKHRFDTMSKADASFIVLMCSPEVNAALDGLLETGEKLGERFGPKTHAGHLASAIVTVWERVNAG